MYWLLSAPRWMALWAYFCGGAPLFFLGEAWSWVPSGLSQKQTRLARSSRLCRASDPTSGGAAADAARRSPPRLAVCWAAVVAVGLLLRRQVRLLLRGETYLDSRGRAGAAGLGHQEGAAGGGAAAGLQHYWAAVAPAAQALLPPAAAAADGSGAAAGPASAAAVAVEAAGHELDAWRNVRRVFGAGHPLTWLLPAWDVAAAPDDGGAGRRKVL